MQTYYVSIYTRLRRDDERAGESVSIENQQEMLGCYVRNRVGTFTSSMLMMAFRVQGTLSGT